MWLYLYVLVSHLFLSTPLSKFAFLRVYCKLGWSVASAFSYVDTYIGQLKRCVGQRLGHNALYLCIH